jgi:hypothetical protein
MRFNVMYMMWCDVMWGWQVLGSVLLGGDDCDDHRLR